jgi:16S rRNA (cytidine1402-2'-O)-methyltransferase
MSSGTLFIVGTPIGNLGDITYRAVEVLREADVIAAEDTRHTKRLLKKYDIETPLVSYHQHSNSAKVLQKLEAGDSIALVSDAGTPGISDPGAALIGEVVTQGFTVVPIPGPGAFLTALSGSGLPLDRFTFFGFIPQKKGRETFLKNLVEMKHTAVFYESTHRIEKCARQLADFMPERYVVFARELTKMHEEFIRGSASEVLQVLSENPIKQKGEFCVLVSGTGFRKE